MCFLIVILYNFWNVNIFIMYGVKGDIIGIYVVY